MKSDIRSAFLVFLIAMPLSLGIAVASGAPASAGLLSVIVGGMLGAWVSGCRVAIAGPAAGLIVTVAAAIHELGGEDPLAGYQAMLGCLVVAGLIQMGLAYFRLASVGLAFPKAVVHGMLAALGVIIVVKQFHILLGVLDVKGGAVEALLRVPATLTHFNSAVAVVGISSLALYLLWRLMPQSVQGLLPAALMATCGGALMAAAGQLYAGWELSPEQFLSVPTSLSGIVVAPRFDLIGTLAFWKHSVLIALIAGAESVLSVCAVDRLTPGAERSDLDRDLMGKGLVNVILGLIGGLPVITEIVRSSANVTQGGRSQWANFFQAAFVLLFLALLPGILFYGPLAALAAVLIVTGWRLASPERFVEAFRHGWDQGAVFMMTVVTILATDILTGVLIGTLCEFLFVAFQAKTWRLFDLSSRSEHRQEDKVLSIEGALSFANYLTLRRHLSLEDGPQRLVLDLRQTVFIDHHVRDQFDALRRELSQQGAELIVVPVASSDEPSPDAEIPAL